MSLDAIKVAGRITDSVSVSRHHRVLESLNELGIPSKPEYVAPGRYNLTVSFKGDRKRQYLLLSAHHDRVASSGGANDNASGVAALFGVAEHLYHSPPSLPVKIVFFDLEEEDLGGSQSYVKTHGVKDILATLNLDMVGRGLVPVLWPYESQSPEFVDALKKAIPGESQLKGMIRECSGDHQSFLEAGLRDALTMTLFYSADARTLAKKTLSRDDLRKTLTFCTTHREGYDGLDLLDKSSVDLATKVTLAFIDEMTRLYRPKLRKVA